MAMSRSEIVARSDAKKGMQAKTYKLPIAVVAKIEQLAKDNGIPQNQLIIQAVELFEQSQKGA
ncbi:ribbon-helix-helix protein, CopG family [Actinobacillus seminis]|uniref:ribbon-helix-helix protein, CopG family n=1 Tax=Actinobacillus seminis TaxID=722 RepID=UPI003B935F23